MPRSHPLLVAVAVLTFIFLLGPLLIVIATALNDKQVLSFPPTGFTLEWFHKALTLSAFQRSFVTSVQVSVAGTCISLLFGIPAAYALNRYAVRLPKSLSVLFVLPVLVPEIVFGFSLLANVQVGFDLPLIPTLILGHALLVLPYSVRVVSASLAAFDFSTEEAAISLGSPPLKTFFTVPTGYDVRKLGNATAALTGLDVYSSKAIPGWDTSILVCGMASGVIYRIPLNALNAPPLTYFKAQDRYRDLAIAPDGKRIYAITSIFGRTETAAGEPTATLEHPGALLEFTYVGPRDTKGKP